MLTPTTHDLEVIFPSSQYPSSCTSGELQEGKQDGFRFLESLKGHISKQMPAMPSLLPQEIAIWQTKSQTA